nr:retrovirus-related Pol polyprotein from transposon TNT 1-94 [Tanacetum cinerariifolium]
MERFTIKEYEIESEVFVLLKIGLDLFTYDIPLEMIFDVFRRLSSMEDDLFAYELGVLEDFYFPCVEQPYDNLINGDLDVYELRQCYNEYERMFVKAIILIDDRLVKIIDITLEQWFEIKFRDHKKVDKEVMEDGLDTDVECDPTNVEFAIWLASKFSNHMTMDWYTKNELWLYWKMGDDEEVVTNDELSNLEEESLREDDALSKEKEIDKLMALISLSFKKIYKPTNNNLRTSSNTSKVNKIILKKQQRNQAKDVAYHKEKMLLCKKEEVGVLMMNMKIRNWKHIICIWHRFKRQHHEQPKSVNDTYPDEQGDINITTNSMDMSTNGEEADQDDDDLAREHALLSTLIKKLEVILTTSVSRPHLKINRLEDRFMHNNSQGKKQEVEEHRRNFKFSNNKTSITACNDNLNVKTSDAKFVCVLVADLDYITLQDTSTPNPICLMAKASLSQAWLWHRRLSHMNFDTINLLLKYDIATGLPKLKFVKDHLCSSCELRKAKRKSFKTKTIPISKRRLQILHMDLCGPMREESFNGKKYELVIVDDYSRYT